MGKHEEKLMGIVSDELKQRAQQVKQEKEALEKASEPQQNIMHGEQATMNVAKAIHQTIHHYGVQESQAAKIDRSALEQGRHIVSERTKGEKVEPKHMTPKEYRNFNAGLWDGIENKDYRYNWSPMEWEKIKVENKPKRIVERQPINLERRQKDRRHKSTRLQIEERRSEERRKQDKLDAITYRVCLSISFLIILTITIGVIATHSMN